MDRVLESEQDAGLRAVVLLGHQHSAPLQQVAMTLKGEVNCGVEKGMARSRRLRLQLRRLLTATRPI